jgi:hypothetical protein
MDLSLRDAAKLLGKSPRQVRYMMQTGRIKARKDGGRWVIPRKELPLSDTAVARGLADQARLKDVLEGALGTPGGSAGAKRRYSVTDLKVFGVGCTLLTS